MRHQCLRCDGRFKRFSLGPWVCPVCKTDFHYDDDEDEFVAWYATICTWKGWWKRRVKLFVRWVDKALGIVE